MLLPECAGLRPAAPRGKPGRRPPNPPTRPRGAPHKTRRGAPVLIGAERSSKERDRPYCLPIAASVSSSHTSASLALFSPEAAKAAAW